VRILAVDVGGTHVKALLQGEPKRRRFKSGPRLTAARMVEKTLALVEGWEYDRVSVGVPAQVADGRVAHEPVNLGGGWVGFDFQGAFGRPTKVVNDAVMQAVGSYEGGRMLFLGLGTGLGTTLIVNGVIVPLEGGHLPYRKGRSFEDYVGSAGFKRLGKRKWTRYVFDVVARLKAAFIVDYVVLGGGNVKKLDELPPACRHGDNANAFVGGFRLWNGVPTRARR
jgi:polyphosphate glucokinase